MLFRTIDLSSAFCTLYHNILSIRLNEISIYDQVHSWFMYFDSARTSSVKINSSLSPPYFNIHCVPQGYLLSHIGSLYSPIVHYLYYSYK